MDRRDQQLDRQLLDIGQCDKSKYLLIAAREIAYSEEMNVASDAGARPCKRCHDSQEAARMDPGEREKAEVAGLGKKGKLSEMMFIQCNIKVLT